MKKMKELAEEKRHALRSMGKIYSTYAFEISYRRLYPGTNSLGVYMPVFIGCKITAIKMEARVGSRLDSKHKDHMYFPTKV